LKPFSPSLAFLGAESAGLVFQEVLVSIKERVEKLLEPRRI
jgi:hypothetical protein